MKTIWCFGDSNTAEYNLNYQWTNEYINWKGYIPNHWTKLLSNKLNLPYKNFGKNGSDNYSIFDSVVEYSDIIRDNDIIIINWTTPIRFRIAENDKFRSIIIDSIHHPVNDVSISTLNEIAVNRSSIIWMNEIFNWMKLLKKAFINNKIVFWAPFTEFNNVNGVLKIGNIKTKLSISKESNGVVQDYHMGETGCIEFAEIMYNYLIKSTIM